MKNMVRRPPARPGRFWGLERLILGGRSRLRSLTESLRGRSITLTDWARVMLADVQARLTAGALILLGTSSPPLPDLGSLARRVGIQAGFLRRYRLDLRGRPVTGRDVVRSTMYADATWAVPIGVEKDRMERDGYEEAMRVLGASAHCDDCVSVAGYWMPIWQCPQIGDSVCGSRCNCRISYRGPSGTIL